MSTRDPRPELAALAKRLDLTVRLIGERKQAARVAGVTVQQIWRYVSGRSEPTSGILAALAKAANVDLAWLTTGEGEPHLARAPHQETSPSASPQREIDIFLTVALRYAQKPTDESANALRVAASDIRTELEDHCARSSVRL